MEFPRQFVYAGPAYSTRDTYVPAPLFRKSFQAEAGMEARLLIGAAGFYELYVNGKRMTKGALAPYISAPSDIVYYDSYRLDNILLNGDNALGVMLGNGMQNNPGGYVWDFEKALWRGAPRFALALLLRAEDGTETLIESDETFLTLPSAIQFDDLRYGEIYDAGKHRRGWAEPFFDDGDWTPALRCQAPTGEARLCDCEPVVVTRELSPLSITREEAGWRYDFGENWSGVCRLRIAGRPGQRVTLYHGEYVHDGRLDLSNIKFEDRYFKDDMIQRDVYICKGDGVETYTPTFTYHGFQYVLVKGIDESQATPDLLTYLVMNSRLSERGGFSCSGPVANKLQEITRRSDLSNFVYFPTDCPQREKNGWTADAALSAEHMLLNLSPERSYAEWLRNIRKAQTDAGALPGIVPTGGWGYAWGNGPAWDNVLFLLPYYVYLYRGDASIVRENAGAMLKYLHYIDTRRDADGLLAIGLGDWCPVGRESSQYKSPLRFTDSVLTADMAEKAAYLFEKAGYAKEAAYARAFYEELRAAIRARLLDLTTMTALGNCQTSQAMAIYYDMFDPAEKPLAFSRLLEYIDGAEGHMDVGVLGGRVLFHVLTAFGRSDLAYHMITRTDFPAYGNWVARGATTLWEMFQPEGERPASLNHHFWGDISGWFIQALGGIRVNPHRGGCHEIDLRPAFVPQLHHAEGFHIAPCGRVSCAWRRVEENAVQLTVDYPEGASGQIVLEPGWTFADGLSTKDAVSGVYALRKQP